MRAKEERIETTAAQINARRRTAAEAFPLSKNEFKRLPTSSLRPTLKSMPAPNPAEAPDSRRYDNSYMTRHNITSNTLKSQKLKQILLYSPCH